MGLYVPSLDFMNRAKYIVRLVNNKFLKSYFIHTLKTSRDIVIFHRY